MGLTACCHGGFFIWSGGFRFGLLMVFGSGVSHYVCLWVWVVAM